ncbi:acetyl-CoA carboxylase, carboxyl transferase, alpha subunit [Hyphomonas neptunium ATCC 15444]|uniref:Acetyl-coenzyme A carboxylase carboxyl transferase subunit alpha n=2 Tax=Hyphomonas TaxID=85 RepID=Q0C318_HYPNA|nr:MULTISPECIES: acetyl-CoA carboxylase carboxyltransferase subunit alpha [Hyphomonas]ABI77814.1 acetyl-CoA carboxylase, carboxyl transferase, alpha subunit [Hyphomonas neptunium ATCC 15444]KCZ95888.1 acetyl-CoA carboxylase carboxyl transferase subunit alpha [Hyphomonas hirschiana VP5]
MATYLEFEKPIAELDAKIAELEALAARKDGPLISDELAKLKTKSVKQLKQIYSELNAWRVTQVARHPDRPHLSDFINTIFEDFEELAGDRVFGNDEAIIGGLARFKGRSVVVIGHEKGRTTEKRLKHNFGMAHPEGYRKAVRLMDLAEKFNIPVLSFPDTAGAYPGKGGEERGQAEAIARGTQRGLSLGVPFVTLIIGEGMSGGAIGIAAANRVLMMEYAIYSVISPEGCASILYRDATKAKDAAEAMGITAPELLRHKIVDGIVKEPVGGAHRDPQRAMASAAKAIDAVLQELEGMSPAELRAQRRERFYAIGREGL